MTRTWKLFSLVAVTGALGLYLLPGGAARPTPAFAADCTTGHTGTLVISILDTSTNGVLNEAGAQVLINPDPRDFNLDEIVVDTASQDASASQDKDSDPGVIRYEGACSTGNSSPYVISLWALPSDLSDCEIGGETASTALDEGETKHVTLQVDCTGVGPTPTVTPTATVGPVATVQVNASPLAISCNGTSVISVEVHDAAGNPVQTGTGVSITSTMGSINPSSGFVTGSAGTVFTFFSAPQTTGGTAIVTATAGSVSGSASVAVNCGGVNASATSTVAPPPAVGSSSGVITPPNTGDAGLADTRHSTNAAVLAVVIAGALGCLSVAGMARRSGI